MTVVGGPGRRAEVGEESRRRLLDAAQELFATRGVEGTSFVQIEALAGISRGSILWHFKSKEGLLVAVLDRVVSQVLPDGLPSGDEGLSALLAAWTQLLEMRSGDFLLAMLIEAADPASAIHDTYLAMHDRIRGLFVQWLLANPQYRLPGVAVADQAQLLLALGPGMRAQMMLQPGAVDLEAASHAVRLWLESIAVANAAQSPRTALDEEVGSNAGPRDCPGPDLIHQG